jgi:hypothetical protein
MKPNIEIVANWWFCSLKFSYKKDVIRRLTLAGPIVGLLLLVPWLATTGRLVESYKEILVIACEEASEWSISNPRFDVDLTCLESAALEWVLQKRGMPIHVWIFALLQ